jgi:dolichol kinase
MRVGLHLVFAFVPLIYWSVDISRWAMLAACLPILVGIAFDLWRIRSPIINEFVHDLWGGLLKESESQRLTGSSHYFIGILTAILLFPKSVAVCASLYMTWADPAALLVGQRSGRKAVGEKTWEGFGAFTAVAFLIGLYFFSWPVALTGAVVAGLVELFTPGWANDNSLLPVASGLVLTFLT